MRLGSEGDAKKSLHHIPNRVAYCSALKAHLKPGARLAIVDFRKEAQQEPPVEFRFTPDQISGELAQVDSGCRPATSSCRSSSFSSMA